MLTRGGGKSGAWGGQGAGAARRKGVEGNRLPSKRKEGSRAKGGGKDDSTQKGREDLLLRVALLSSSRGSEDSSNREQRKGV